MKYCQKCKVMLKDEVEVCPVCGTAQLPEEEFAAKAQKKQKTKKALIIAAAALVVVLVAAYALIMILGKEPKKIATDEEFTAELTDPGETAQFSAYIMTALPQVWAGSDEDADSAIEYYRTDFPDVAAGFEQLKELKPVAGDLTDLSLDSIVKSEEGRYKLSGVLICNNRKVDYALILGPSGYVDSLSFILKEETPVQKAREFLLEKTSEL